VATSKETKSGNEGGILVHSFGEAVRGHSYALLWGSTPLGKHCLAISVSSVELLSNYDYAIQCMCKGVYNLS